MSEDIFEKYVREHRDAFDIKEPPAHVWTQVDKQLHRPKSKVKNLDFRVFMVAASSMLILAMGVLIGLTVNKQEPESYTYIGSNELAQTESYYALKVKEQLHSLESEGIDQSEFQSDLNQLDEVYHELKAELKTVKNQNAEQVVGALILNYQTKLNILQRIQNRTSNKETIQKINKRPNENIEI